MKDSKGFTVIEVLVVVVFLAVVTTVLMIQRSDLQAAGRDKQRKTAINAMYYTLEEVYYEKTGSYPARIDSKTLRAVDPALFSDPYGVRLGEPTSDYRYEPTGCDNTVCKGYSLRADLEKEDDYVKTNRNK